MIKYRIAWAALETGARGHGEPVFVTREMAADTARKLNKEHDGIMLHWVEDCEIDTDEVMQ